MVTGNAELRQDADWLIDTYEPRAAIKSITMAQSDTVNGGFLITAEIEGKGE
jgi:hypothetical protein